MNKEKLDLMVDFNVSIWKSYGSCEINLLGYSCDEKEYIVKKFTDEINKLKGNKYDQLYEESEVVICCKNHGIYKVLKAPNVIKRHKYIPQEDMLMFLKSPLKLMLCDTQKNIIEYNFEQCSISDRQDLDCAFVMELKENG